MIERRRALLRGGLECAREPFITALRSALQIRRACCDQIVSRRVLGLAHVARQCRFGGFPIALGELEHAARQAATRTFVATLFLSLLPELARLDSTDQQAHREVRRDQQQHERHADISISRPAKRSAT